MSTVSFTNLCLCLILMIYVSPHEFNIRWFYVVQRLNRGLVSSLSLVFDAFRCVVI